MNNGSNPGEIYTQETERSEKNEDSEQESRKKQKRSDLIARIMAIVAALLLWFYVYSLGDAEAEYAEKTLMLKIEVRGLESLKTNRLGIDNMDFDQVSLTVSGEKKAIGNVKDGDIVAYINIDKEIADPGSYQFPVRFDTGSLSVTKVEQSVSEVTVRIDKSTSRSFDVSGGNVHLSGWTLPEGFVIDDVRTVNVDKIVVAGMTLELEKIKEIRVSSVSSMLITEKGNMKTDAQIELYDQQGNAINTDHLTITAYSGGKIVEDIVIGFTVNAQNPKSAK